MRIRGLDMPSETVSEKKDAKINIALSVEDKKLLKIYAAERGVTVASLIHEYAEQIRKEREKNEYKHS